MRVKIACCVYMWCWIFMSVPITSWPTGLTYEVWDFPTQLEAIASQSNVLIFRRSSQDMCYTSLRSLEDSGTSEADGFLVNPHDPTCP